MLSPALIRIRGPIRYLLGHQTKGKKQSPERRSKASLPMERNGRWKGGRFTDTDGYILVKSPEHPFANNANYVREHRLVMEQHLGRFLQPSELVHHLNSIKHDNRIENLQLIASHAEHVRIERTGKKYPRANGVWFTCQRCQEKFYRSAYWANRSVKHCSWSCRYPKSPEHGFIHVQT